MSTWKTLSAIDCSKHVEKKGNLSYLSWAWAWQTLMEHYPDSTYTFSDPMTLCGETVEVSVSVSVKGITHTMWLPVMDNRNKSIVNPTSRDISDARMRCLVKCIAMFGLGIYLYAGEDLPQAVQNAVVSGDQAKEIKGLIEEHGVDVKVFLKHFKATSVDEMLAVHYSKAVAALNAKAKK
jgi:hypothetical protein|tara:strand:- start:25 stop:564 length:540 start_codon:yes stop_codon:yes gene_type:complete